MGLDRPRADHGQWRKSRSAPIFHLPPADSNVSALTHTDRYANTPSYARSGEPRSRPLSPCDAPESVARVRVPPFSPCRAGRTRHVEPVVPLACPDQTTCNESGPALQVVRQVAEDVGVGRLRRVLGVAALLLGVVAVPLCLVVGDEAEYVRDLREQVLDDLL